MRELLERMREGRKSPQVLRIKLIEIRSSRPAAIIFFFESYDDISVYEEWFRRVARNPTYEAVPGNGKEQLIAMQLILEQDGKLDGVYFFVDHDYDENPELTHVFVLDAYSIENILCNEHAVESILIDELRCAGAPQLRQRVIEAFRDMMDSFRDSTNELHERLFIARRNGFRVNNKPKHAKDFLDITLNSAHKKFTRIEEIVEISVNLSPDRTQKLSDEFSKLDARLACRGKYMLQAFRTWLKLLTDDRKSLSPILFHAPEKIPGSPEQVTFRRLASASPLPSGLCEFTSRVAR